MLGVEAAGYRIAVGGQLCIVFAMALQLDSAFLRNDIRNGRWKLGFWIPHFCGMTFKADTGRVVRYDGWERGSAGEWREVLVLTCIEG